MAPVKTGLNYSDDEEYTDFSPTYSRKRKRANIEHPLTDTPEPTQWFSTMLEVLSEWHGSSEIHENAENSFHVIMDGMLPDLLAAEGSLQERLAERDDTGQLVKPLSRREATVLREDLSKKSEASPLSAISAIVSQKLKLQSGAFRRELLHSPAVFTRNESVTPLSAPHTTPTVNTQVLDALYAIETTPYECSFLSRLQGFQPSRTPKPIGVDWETRSPWMELLSDIREHFSLSHPERDQPVEVAAPIEYTTLHAFHLDQIHDILARTFWEGINVSDSLQYSPEKSTIVATYKQLVVGVALISSPQETYITYLAVRAGWENSQIATTMLYYLITLNPNRDITLHVSINNPAMLLYNRFGFKAEEFIVGFYEDYLDPQSRASKNAFRLRLRR